MGVFFFFNDTATTEIYTLSLHDALPICRRPCRASRGRGGPRRARARGGRSEEHTSELQSLAYLVCRLLLEKKKNTGAPVMPNRRPSLPAARRSCASHARRPNRSHPASTT